MTYIPFTREALALIKNGATAIDLGWSELFYVRICREHGLQPTLHRPKTHTQPVIAAPPIAPKPLSCTQASVPRKKVDDNLIVAIKRSSDECVLENCNILRRGSLFVHLSPNQAVLLRAIIKFKAKDSVSVDRIAVLMDVSLASAKIYVSELRRKLRTVGIVIPRLTRECAFVMRDFKTELPANIRIIEAGE